jgi:hypothetical protein
MMFGFANPANAQTIRNERNVRDILRSLNSKIDDFRYTFSSEVSRNSITRADENEVNGNLRDFKASLTRFEDKFQDGAKMPTM